MLRKRSGFTLIELLVVIAIIAILVALLLPAVQQVREAARKSQCQDHLHNIVIAVISYEGSFKVLPMGSGPDGTVGTGIPAWGWGAALLPNIEQKPLFDSLGVGSNEINVALANPNLTPLMQRQIDLYLCPSDNSAESHGDLRGRNGNRHDPNWSNTNAPAGFFTATSNYVANAGHKQLGSGAGLANTGPLFRRSRIRIAQITDGTSNVLFIGERDQECAAATWVGTRSASGNGPRGNNHVLGNVFQKPNGVYTGGDLWAGVAGTVNTQTCLYGFSSKHPGGTQFAFGDGRVTMVSENIDFNNNFSNGAANCNQDQDTSYTNTACGGPLGVYQRLGVRDDGLPVRAP